MPEAYIVEAVRTPVGKKNGGLSTAHPADLGAHVLNELVCGAAVAECAVREAMELVGVAPVERSQAFSGAVVGKALHQFSVGNRAAGADAKRRGAIPAWPGH